MEMWSITGLRVQLLLSLLMVHSAVVVSGITVWLKRKNYQNHSVVPIWRITASEPLACTATVCGGCSLNTTNSKWFYPDSTEVTDNTSNLLYTTGAVKTNQSVTVNLYRRGPPASDQFRPQGRGSGLYRCRIQTSGHSVQNVYVGLYRGQAHPIEGKPIVNNVQFHLDNASTDPFQFGPPVFTLTCHSTGGPATTVTWKKGEDPVRADANHIMTRTLVEQDGPVYSTTLTVSGREEGWFSCKVTNTKGYAQERNRVQGTNSPRDLTAEQEDAITVLVSWRTPSVGSPLTPSGYRISYHPEGGQTITTPDTGPDVREYRLTNLMSGTTYMIAMVTLSEKLPSPPTNPVSITLGLGLTVSLKGQKFQNHEVAPVWQITESEPLTCTATVCIGCSVHTANPKWFYPDGADVTDSNSSLLYTTSAMKTNQSVTLNLYKRSELDELSSQDGRGVGLYNCRMQTTRSASSVQNIYVGLYRGHLYPNEGQPNITSLDFQLDKASNDPFQSRSGPPVFTLTCHSTGGPATTVTWKKESTVLIADENHIMTRTLVEQSGPVYSNTLTVSGWELGWFSCNVSNTQGNSGDRYRVQGASRPCNLTAVQTDATTVLVSWKRSHSGGLPPSGYRIFYRPEGGQPITAPDTGPGVREYQLTDLIPGTTYMIAMVTLSEKLPSLATNPVNITLVPAPSTPSALIAKEVNTKSMTITWNDRFVVENYTVSFIGVTNCSEMKHTGSHILSCSTQKCSCTLSDLNEYSHYSITVTAVNARGNASATIHATTLPAPPSSPPENVRGTAGVYTITVQWDEVDCIDRNSEIVYYSLTYTSPNETESVLINADNIMVYTIRGLRPDTNYTIELAAVNTADQVGPKATITLQTPAIPAPNPPTAMVSEGGLTSKSITSSWSNQPRVENYLLTFIGVTRCSRMHHHSGNYTVYCGHTSPKCTYNLTGLNEYSNYSITVTAVNVAGNASATISATTLAGPPSGLPKNLTGTAGVSTITVQWDEVDCIDRNSEILNYSLTYTSNTEREMVLFSANKMIYTIRGLRPVTKYAIELAAVNTAGQVGPKATLDVTTLPSGQDQSEGHSRIDEGSVIAAIVMSVCLVATIAVATTAVVIIARWAYTRRVSSTTADVRKESKTGHELYSISTADCVAYGTATNRSGDCQEARDYEIPAVTSTSLPMSATACEQVKPAIYEPIPH